MNSSLKAALSSLTTACWRNARFVFLVSLQLLERLHKPARRVKLYLQEILIILHVCRLEIFGVNIAGGRAGRRGASFSKGLLQPIDALHSTTL